VHHPRDHRRQRRVVARDDVSAARHVSRIEQYAYVIDIRRATREDADACVEILARLPDYFTDDTHKQARAGIGENLAWVAVEAESIEGFVLVELRYPTAAEITIAAVKPERRGTGIGTHLVHQAIDYLRVQGVTLVEAKTLDASAGYEPYVATRAFWERRGFVQIDCIDPLPGWQPGNPSALYVAALSATR
jgi:GNAT superfamily N-acetyltransferase